VKVRRFLWNESEDGGRVLRGSCITIQHAREYSRFRPIPLLCQEEAKKSTRKGHRSIKRFSFAIHMYQNYVDKSFGIDTPYLSTTQRY
jgi:hypothetical protein